MVSVHGSHAKCTDSLDYLAFAQSWKLMLTATYYITAFSFVLFCFPAFSLGEGVSQTFQLTNMILCRKSNSGCLTWFASLLFL